MTVPEWVQDAVFYQVFPDRFANGDPGNDPPNVQRWGAPPTLHGFQGGDLRGVIDRLDYLLDLGVTALYLNPVFSAPSNHRYNTNDYYTVDPRLGGLHDLRALLDRAHGHGLRVILDGVFNHCGRGFFAFQDLLENEQHSAYREWFHVRRFPLEAYGPGPAEAYRAWWDIKSLPKFNTANPAVRAYLLGVARHWIEQGADGWRLDVPNEIDDDSFWAAFRQAVKAANPAAYLVGEIWEADPRWVGPGHFDGLMNYPLRQALLSWIAEGRLTPSGFGRRLEELLTIYPAVHNHAHFLTLGSHDTERVRTLCGGQARKVRLLYLLLFSLPGAPAIYYGDEIGLEGGKDPACRAAFPWDEAAWDGETRAFVQRLIALRKDHAALRRGGLALRLADDAAGTLAFVRGEGQGAVLCAANASAARRTLRLHNAGLGWPEGAQVREALAGARLQVGADAIELSLDPWSGALLTLAPAG